MPARRTGNPRYGDAAPFTAENFAGIALGDTPGGVSYVGTRFHRVIENFIIQARPRPRRSPGGPPGEGLAVGSPPGGAAAGRSRPPRGRFEGAAHARPAAAQPPLVCWEPPQCRHAPPQREPQYLQGGDVQYNDGAGSFTIWDGPRGRFRDEDLSVYTHVKGALSMANYGPNSNGAFGALRWRVLARACLPVCSLWASVWGARLIAGCRRLAGPLVSGMHCSTPHHPLVRPRRAQAVSSSSRPWCAAPPRVPQPPKTLRPKRPSCPALLRR